MIILTGSRGFIGKKFTSKLSEKIVEVEQGNAFKFISGFDKWDQVSLIIHPRSNLIYRREKHKDIASQ